MKTDAEKASKPLTPEKERAALLQALKDKNKECEGLKKEMKALSASVDKRSAKLSARERELNSLENAAKEEYFIAAKNVKLLIDKLDRLSSGGAPLKEKEAIIHLFKDLFKKIDDVSAIRKAVAKANNAIGDQPEEEEPLFDLDAAMNPKGELDLKKLCEELGVFDD